MSIVVDETTPVVVQGITGRLCSFHTEEMLGYGTNIVAGVTPGKGGEKVNGVPVFDTVRAAVEETGATASIVFVPPPFAADAIMEAASSGIRSCVCITDGIPVQDMMRVKRYMRRYRATNKMRLTGPNCAGTITPGETLLGIMPGHIYTPGRVGIVGRSGTLGYEAAAQMSDLGIGVSTSVGIGGDPVRGLNFIDCLELFEQDPQTEGIIMVGEIGGTDEEAAARHIAAHVTKPVVAYIAGVTAPPGKRMGHAGAIISGGEGTAEAKYAALEEANVHTVRSPAELGSAMQEQLGG